MIGPAAPAGRRGRLFRRYFALILGLVCGTLVISGGTSLYFSYQESKAALAALQEEKALTAATHIGEFVRRVEQQLAFAAPQLGDEALEQRRLELMKLQRFAKDVTDVAEIAADGRERLFESRLAMSVVASGKDRSAEPAFREARPGQAWFGPVYFRKETEPYMSIAVRSGRDKGPVIVAEVNLKFMWDVVTRIKVGQKGKAYVVDRNGYLIADPDIGLVLRKTDLSALAQVKAALQGEDGERAMLAADPGGRQVLTAWAPVEPLGWRVFVEQPASEVFQALDATILRTVALIVAGLVLSALAALWLARSMARPIGVLQQGAQRIGAGELDHEIDVRTGDELEALAGEFNRMTAQLRESYAGLERKVEERTSDLTRALDYQAASAEILSSISNSISDTAPVFDAIARNIRRLLGTQFAVVRIIREGRLELVAFDGEPRFERIAQAQATTLDEGSVAGEAVLSKRIVQYAPVQGNPAAPERARKRASSFGFDAIITAPMMRDDEVIGVMATARRDPIPFDDKQIALLKTFADQAVIAIENVRLFTELQSRNRELTSALEQQTATGEILKVISSSPTDIQPVFDTITRNAVQLCDATWGALFTHDGDTMDLGAMIHSNEELVQAQRRAFPRPVTRGTPADDAILERSVINIADIQASDYGAEVKARARAGGFRSVLAVPIMRGGVAAGVLLLTRGGEPRRFTEQEVALVSTFADQAVIAIENVRLFNETKEALEQQKASGDVLGAISNSIADTRPVFAKIRDACQRLFEGNVVAVTLVSEDRQRIELVAYDGPEPERMRAFYPLPLSRDSGSGLAALEKAVLHYPNISADAVPELIRKSAGILGFKAIVFAPMLFEGQAIGAICVSRSVAGPFGEKQIALLRTFADQAVIAIQNARLFREIQEKSAQLEVANKHKSEFLANMSHELRTPLNAIIGFSEVLMERMFGEVNEKQLDYLKDIHESGRHLLSLINDILDLSKIEAGRMDLEVSSFHLPSALSNAMTLVRERAQRHGIALGLEVDQRLGEIAADERKVKQILLNLLSNAVKFTPDGGRVDVAARLDTTKVEIAVRDTGVGIAPEDQQAVFEEFKQVGRDYTRKAEGTGLGLALTKRFVELHGGEIRLESVPGKGSTFTFTLPVRA